MGGKQGQFSAQLKLDRVLEVRRGEKAIAPIWRARQGTDWQVYKWRQEFLEKGSGLFESQPRAASVGSDPAERIAELEGLVGQLSMANALEVKGSNWLEAARRRNGLCSRL